MAASDYPCILLEDCALLPFQLLPLHLFEPRYRRMIEDALAGDRRFAVGEALTNEKGIEMAGPWATLGRILSHQTLPDGRHLVLLEGEVRLKVETLSKRKPYPVLRATLTPDGESGPHDHILLAQCLALVERLLGELPPADEAESLLPRLQQLAAAHPGRFADAAAGHLIPLGALRRKLLGLTEPAVRLGLLREFLAQAEVERGLGPQDPDFDPRVN